MPEQPLTNVIEFDPEDEYRPEPESEPAPPTWMDGTLRIGIHTSIAGGYINALESARKLGCNALQIFSASPRMWAGGPSRIAEVDATAFRARREAVGLGPLVIHANYLINLAAQQPMLRTRSIQAFHDELVRGVALGADFVVVHPGACGECKPDQAVRLAVESVKQAAKNLPANSLRILLENTAGMGTALGARLEDVGEMLNALQALHVGACLDTAHLFAAGYDIKSEAGLASTLELIERIIGLERVPVFHINDSKIPLGGRVDRHEHIGKGKIGAEAFRRLLTHPRLSAAVAGGLPGRAFVAETPIDDPGDDRRNVAALWEFAGLKDQAPTPEKGFSMLTAAAKKKVAQQVKSSQAASRKMRAHVAAADRRGRLSTHTKKSLAKPKTRRKKG
ncbi:MAG TPA: deoxyribonuclease IV [Candidatus Acidoferrum sp.]|nr:deoxyribonuclease IV [Candidatus Acidoferrum sp.]